MKNRLLYILYIVLVASLSACNDVLDFGSDDEGIKVGDEVGFCARVPKVESRMTKTEYDELINRFEHVQDDYIFLVDMWEKSSDAAGTKLASAEYNPTKNTVNNVTTYDEYGTLTESVGELFWPSNVNKYAFHAVSNNTSDAVEQDQSTLTRYMTQDRIEGYGYVPGWDAALNEGIGAPVRELDGLNYLTTKEWYAANKAWGAPGELSQSQLVEYWKKVPLFMRHKRSRITVLLKAGEGVERDQIAFNPELNFQNISINVFSYDKTGTPTAVTPLLGSYDCQYKSPDPAPEEKITTACYDAIVEPHNYAEGTNMTEQKMLAINLSGMKFSFYAANDKAFSSAPGATNDDVKARYNLTEGKHLILEVTLSTDTRKILITAYVVDWEDWPFSSICDDFGQPADPMPINNKAELIEFLTNPDKNKPGNVGVIMPLNLNLIDPVVLTEEEAKKANEANLTIDATGKKPGEAGYTKTYVDGYVEVHAGQELAGAGWDPKLYELRANLKLAGATITTNQRLFDKISVSGSVVNGTIVIADKDKTDAPIECAVARENYGTVERLSVLRGDTERRATRAGIVTKNYGIIYACSSQLPVYNPGGAEEVLIGGIAAEMSYPKLPDGTADVSARPVIDLCYVDARIDGGANVKGGGIAGQAEGKLTNNIYEYGITLLQDPDRFKNILYANGTQDSEFTGNEWSTKVANAVLNGSILTNGRPEADRYNQVIDSQAELYELVTKGAYNNNSSRFRIADSFTVDGDSWTLGVQNQALSASGNLLCELNCNNKTITLTGTTYAKMLFSNIQGRLYNLVLVLDKPIVALPDENAAAEVDKLPARAPLAYAVVGDKAALSNVKVKATDGAYVQSTASGGLVVWAYDGALIEDCQSNVDVRIALPEGTGNQQVYFVGGLVNSAAKATILRCTYQCDGFNDSEKAYATGTSNIYYGGIVGGTNTKGIYAPSLNISDCTSWLTWEPTEVLPYTSWGGIIGYSKYQNVSSDLVTSTDGKCQGNWWAAPVGSSVQGRASGMNDEKVIGKKNSVMPLRDNDY